MVKDKSTDVNFHRDPDGAVYLTSYRYKGGSYAGTVIAESWKDAERKCRALGVELTGIADKAQYPGGQRDG